MPAVSKAQRRLAGMALHEPGKVKNPGMKGMSKPELHKIASTPEKGLPKRKHRRSGGGTFG